MINRVESKKHLRVFGALCILIFAIELIFCFTGPFAFVRKPRLMLFPPFSSGVADGELAEISGFLEREIALTNSYSIISNSFIEEYFIRTDPDSSRTKISVKDSNEALEIAQELNLERFAIATVWKSGYSYHVTLSIRNTRDGKNLKITRIYSPSLEDLKKGLGMDGKPTDFREKITVEVKGIGLTDMLVLGMLGLLLIVGVVSLAGRDPGALLEVLLAPACILFLFAFIHARSANMDYVQRYIANGGALKQAQNTAKAQMYALLRYGPILVLGLGRYVVVALKQVHARIIRKSRMDKYVRPWSFLLTVGAASLYAMSFPSFVRLDGLAPLAWFSLVPLFLVMLAAKPPMALFYGVVFGTVQALIVNYWHGTYNYVTLHMITIAFVVEYVLFMIPFVLAIKISGRWGFITAPLVWTLFDYLRSSGVLGYPWGLVGASQYPFLPLIQIASLTGVWGIGFVVLSVNAGIAWSLAGSFFGWRWPTVSKRFLRRFRILRDDYLRVYILRRRMSSLFPLAIAAVVFSTALITGGIILGEVRSRLGDAPEDATIVLLQQNTDPRKHEYKKNTDILMDLTNRAIAELGRTPDLVAWPEGGFKLDVRYWMQEKNKNAYWGRVVRDFREYQKSLGTWLMTGTQDHIEITDTKGEVTKRNFNSSLLLDAEGGINAFYHKMRLVPFSEHFPLDKVKYAALYEMFQEYDISNWATGDTRSVFQHSKMRLATPICFEDVFPDHVRQFVKNDVDVILNMSNDFWSLSPVEGRQHGILSLFRAVENQRPVLRSTSSGYTVFISATGEIQPGAPEPYTEGYAIATVPLPEKHYTFYTRKGDWFPKASGWIALVLVVCIGVIGVYKRIEDRLRIRRMADVEDVTYRRNVV